MKYYYDAIKFDHSFDSKVWFWSDLHMGHDRDFVLEPRGYSDVEQHDNAIRNAWCSLITTNDIVFLLGDTVLGQNAEDKLEKFIQSVPFRELYIMPGNHSAGWRQLFGQYGPKWCLDGKIVNFIPNYIEISINKQRIVLSHYALASWNHQGRGSFCLHGHSHGSLYNTPIGNELYSARTMDIGVEKCPYPMSFDSIRRKLSKIPIKTFDHH